MSLLNLFKQPNIPFFLTPAVVVISLNPEKSPNSAEVCLKKGLLVFEHRIFVLFLFFLSKNKKSTLTILP